MQKPVSLVRCSDWSLSYFFVFLLNDHEDILSNMNIIKLSLLILTMNVALLVSSAL